MRCFIAYINLSFEIILKSFIVKISKNKMKHSICMVSDFFYPNMGGVEGHIFQYSYLFLFTFIEKLI